MPNFKNRSYQAELMDMPIEDKKALFVNLKELIFLNKLTGGPSVVFKQIKKLFKGKSENLVLLDVGFGAGDLLNYVVQNQNKLDFSIQLSGVDIMPETLEFVELNYPTLPSQANLLLNDYKKSFEGQPQIDIVTANLFCHHLSEQELQIFLKTAHTNARKATIINDLHRHPVAYWFIHFATALISKSAFTKHDAPLSVLRGFTKAEWEMQLQKAGITNYTIEWKWAFRHLITIYP